MSTRPATMSDRAPSTITFATPAALPMGSSGLWILPVLWKTRAIRSVSTVAGPQVLRAPVAAALSSPPPDPLPGLAATLRGLTHEAARFPQLHSASSSSMIRYQTDDEGVVSQPEYTLTKPSNGPNDRDHLKLREQGEKVLAS